MAPIILSSDFHNDYMRFNRCMYVSDCTHVYVYTHIICTTIPDP